MANLTIRKFAKEKNVPLWAVADALGISEPTMTRKLRHELEPEETEKILAVIGDIARVAEGVQA
ncbi:MAG: hypothetical protein IKR49_02045 [Clostridia bacterium]|nr:hypothetical protein [Clostridia bacterium]